MSMGSQGMVNGMDTQERERFCRPGRLRLVVHVHSKSDNGVA